jgi:hypothetical protein
MDTWLLLLPSLLPLLLLLLLLLKKRRHRLRMPVSMRLHHTGPLRLPRPRRLLGPSRQHRWLRILPRWLWLPPWHRLWHRRQLHRRWRRRLR